MSKAADIKKTKTGDFLRTYDINKLVRNMKKSSFSGMMFTVEWCWWWRFRRSLE